MTFLDLQNLTAFWLDDLNFGYFTTTQVQRWLNNAQRETQKILLQSYQNRYIKCATTPMVINQQEYNLPGDFLKLNRLSVITNTSTGDNYPLVSMTINQQDLMPSVSGTAATYYLKRNRIVVYPKPQNSYTIDLLYTYRVTDMVTSNDVPDIPEEYHEYLAVLATYDGLLKDGREIGACLEKRRYYEELMKRDAQERQLDSSKMIVTTENDDMGTYF